MTQLSTPTVTAIPTPIVTPAVTPTVTAEPFVDRRDPIATATLPGVERRQFTNSHDELSPDAKELAVAIDEYKLHHRRRFITYEEMLRVIQSLGYHRD